MKDFNCFIYIKKANILYAKQYLSIRKIPFELRICSNGDYEIGSKEKYSKVLNKLSARCNN